MATVELTHDHCSPIGERMIIITKEFEQRMASGWLFAKNNTR